MKMMIKRLSAGYNHRDRDCDRAVWRALRHHKVILLCLTLTTFLFIGARTFLQPLLQNKDIIHSHAPQRLSSQRLALLQLIQDDVEATRSTKSSSTPNNNNNNNTSTAPATPEQSSSKQYRLGPEIRDWDERRRVWLQRNPSRSNFIAPGKPRVLVATGSAPGRCENPSGDHFLLKSMKNKVDYCRLHGCEVYYNMAVIKEEMTGYWGKLPLLRELMVAHPEVEFIWWMDSDALLTDMAFPIPWERYKDYNLVLPGWPDKVYEEKNWIGLNTGSFFIRNCQWSLDLLDAWGPMGPAGKVRVEAGKLLTRELKDRPDFEADDQSALIYLLSSQRHKWAPRIFFETTYCLHGYWDFLVDRYEEMMEKYKPGFGDDRWPLVTHFVGCKPCAKSGHYPAERCAKQMDRAFDFADNQVLKLYGLAHESLGNMKVKRTTRNIPYLLSN